MTPSSKIRSKIGLTALSALMIAGAVAFTAHAQGQAAAPPNAQPTNTPQATVNDPIGPVPDPTHIPVTLPKDIKWTGTEGRMQTGLLFGDPSKPGFYGVIYKWWPGNFSRPHFHDKERWAYVISGTWWVSTSNTYDEKTTYPAHAGTVAIDRANTIHWDGARTGEKEPAVLVLVGEGPVSTVQVGTDGKPLPPRAGRGN
jgi:quercetin dioxygenase-like cupin family protein